MVRKSLKHADRDRAKEYAGQQSAALAKGHAELTNGRTTLGEVFALYMTYRTPRKSSRSQKEDARRVELWTRVLGTDRDAHDLTLREWENFIDRRTSGEIDARGTVTENRKALRPRVVEADCIWLNAVYAWAMRWRTERGYLMRENPARGLARPDGTLNVRRPVASQDRFERVRAVSDQVLMETRWDHGKREPSRSYLSELLDIVHGTGRRISAACALTYADLRLNDGPHGVIRWPSSTDKMDRESLVPISPRVRAALERIMRERPGVGATPLFPSPVNPKKPTRYELAGSWLREAEKLAGVGKQGGSLWHAYRRGWATSRKHLPDVDVAAAGGWASTDTLRKCYQQPDSDTMLRVVLEVAELREAR